MHANSVTPRTLKILVQISKMLKTNLVPKSNIKRNYFKNSAVVGNVDVRKIYVFLERN